MKDLIIPVNNEAHSRALVEVVGEETALLVIKAYKAIDSAMAFGYQRGLKDGADAQAKEDADDVQAVFGNGYDAGFADAEQSDQASYDDGYVAGVSDARVRPSDADREVARLCQYDEFDDSEEFSEPTLNAHVEGAVWDELIEEAQHAEDLALTIIR